MIVTGTLRGIEGRTVVVTAQVANGALPSFVISGLAEAAQREARVRVQAALAHADVSLAGRVDVACESGGLTIDGAGADLAIALAIARGALPGIGALGELSLSGEVRPVRGVLPIVEAMSERVRIILVASENAREAALVEGIRIVAVRTLREALAYARGNAELPNGARAEPALLPSTTTGVPDMRDVIGHRAARRAIEVAAAGGHNVLLVGPPGAGKTMLARRLPGVLPPMSDAESREVTRVNSAAGLNIGGGLIRTRPFRAPHHSTTPPGLVGGGARNPRPGEVSLAHNGVLFLDELPEFARATLEVLVEPLASGEVVLARVSGTLRFPSRTHLVASMSPCPCGRSGTVRCSCDPSSRARYLARLPEQLIRRFDLRVFVDAIDLAELDRAAADEETALVGMRVINARRRAASEPKIPWEAVCARPLASTADVPGAYERTVRVATTIAALAGENEVKRQHVVEALELTRELSDLVAAGSPGR